MPREDLENVLRGNTQIPLFEERMGILHEIGSVLARKYDGHFMNAVRAAGWDASKLLELITTDFPSYDDHATYNGLKVYFHKRAQLAIFDIHKLLKSRNTSKFTNIDKLTAFADYKVPQALRKFGILEYSPQLAAKVDGRTLLHFGSEEEVEIRANTIWAIEIMKDVLRKRAPKTNSTDIDYCIWMAGQKKSPDDTPYHLCRNTAY
jgi:hypothetical protein